MRLTIEELEELTELECVIDDYCREAVSLGYEIACTGLSVDENMKKCCPLGAVLIVENVESNAIFKSLFGNDFKASSFAGAFDGGLGYPFDLYSSMGARFRERVEAGEYK